MTTIMEKTAGLVAFVRTVETGSFSSASRLIGSSPSAVSKSVARLERRLGVRLIQRSTRTLGLTPEGTAYYERVAPLLRALEDAEDVVQMAKTAKGSTSSHPAHRIGRTLVAAWADAFATRHPEVKLELSITDRSVDLIREGYDVAVRTGPLRDTDLVGRALADLPTVLVASPAYLARRGMPRTIDDLKQHSCLRYLFPAGRPYPYPFADGTSFVPDGPLDADDGEALRQAALSGAGITHQLRFSVAKDIVEGQLVPLLPDIPMVKLPVHVLHAFGRQLPVRGRLFIDFLVEQFSAIKN